MADKIYHCAECQQKITNKPFQHKEINDGKNFCSEQCLSLHYYGKVCSQCQIKTDKIKEGVCKSCFEKNQPPSQSSEEIWAEVEEMMKKMEKDIKEAEKEAKKKKKQENTQQKDTPPPSFSGDGLPLGKCSQCRQEVKFSTSWYPLCHTNSKEEEMFCSSNCFNEYYGKTCHRCQQKTTTYWTVKNSSKVYCPPCKEIEEKKNQSRPTNNNPPVNFESDHQPKKDKPIKTENNNPVPTPPTNQPNPNEGQDIKNEVRVLLGIVKALEGMDKAKAENFNIKFVKNLNQLKRAKVNNILAYQIINGSNRRIDKVLEKFQQLERQQKPSKPSNYAPWLIGGAIIAFFVVIWLVIKKRNKKNKITQKL